MQKRKLGNSNLEVSAIGFGCMGLNGLRQRRALDVGGGEGLVDLAQIFDGGDRQVVVEMLHFRAVGDRRNVVTDRQISLARDRDVIEPRELFFGCVRRYRPHIKLEMNHKYEGIKIPRVRIADASSNAL